MSIVDDNPEMEGPEDCVLCGRVLAALGITLGLFFLYIGIDVVTNGKLTSSLGLGGKAEVDE